MDTLGIMMIVENVRLSEKAKQQLITLKKRTGIEQWNVLCRWALCMSLAEESVPPHEDISLDSSIEMSWKTFSGEYSDIYTAIVRQRILNDYELEKIENEAYYFKLHLHRGISYMMSKIYNEYDLGKMI